MSEEDLPESLKDSVIKKTRKTELGQIVVRRISGVENNKGAQIVRQFEENTGGRGEIIEKMEAVIESLPKNQLLLLDALKADNKRKLARLLAETGVTLPSLMKSYTQGALLLGQTLAIQEAARNLPRILKDLASHALDGTGVCSICVGSGKVPARKGEREETRKCPLCRGNGTTTTISKHKEFAVQKILEVAKMTEKATGPTVNVNQQVGVKVSGGGGGTMEKISMMADEILHGRPVRSLSQPSPDPEVIEAEVVDNG